MQNNFEANVNAFYAETANMREGDLKEYAKHAKKLFALPKKNPRVDFAVKMALSGAEQHKRIAIKEIGLEFKEKELATRRAALQIEKKELSGATVDRMRLTYAMWQEQQMSDAEPEAELEEYMQDSDAEAAAPMQNLALSPGQDVKAVASDPAILNDKHYPAALALINTFMDSVVVDIDAKDGGVTCPVCQGDIVNGASVRKGHDCPDHHVLHDTCAVTLAISLLRALELPEGQRRMDAMPNWKKAHECPYRCGATLFENPGLSGSSSSSSSPASPSSNG